jgi:hypothetical protein
MSKENELYGFVKIDLNNKKVFTQWSLSPNADWSKGEDLVFVVPEDKIEIEGTLKDAYIVDVDITPDAIILYLKAKI